MGRLPVQNRKYNLQYLQAIHREIIRRHYLGQKHAQIAKELKITKEMVSYTINNPLAQQVLACMERDGYDHAVDVQTRIREIAPEALDIVYNTMTDENQPPKLRTDLSLQLLDRAGFGAPRKVEGIVGVGVFSSQDIINMKQNLTTLKPIEVEAEVEG